MCLWASVCVCGLLRVSVCVCVCFCVSVSHVYTLASSHYCGPPLDSSLSCMMNVHPQTSFVKHLFQVYKPRASIFVFKRRNGFSCHQLKRKIFFSDNSLKQCSIKMIRMEFI